MRQALHDAVNGRFLGVQLLTHKAYNLSRSTMTRLHPDGRRDISVEAEPSHVVVSGFAPDIRVIDKDGNVVHDSKRDRIEKKKSIAEWVGTYLTADGLLTSMLESQSAAVRDPNNELVHIYEIREALSTKFGGEREARSALGISCSDWSRLGQLCNNEPLRQGRHRGKSGSALRDATEAELTEARRIALAMIEAYLRHLDTATRACLP
jgi:hypothetical protein